MVEKQDVVPVMKPVRECDKGSDVDEAEVSAEEIMALTAKKLRWSCRLDGCQYRFRILLDQMEAVPFFIVRHLMKDHGLRAWEVAEIEPSLADEVRTYVESMGIEPPATGRTGVSAKMETPR